MKGFDGSIRDERHEPRCVLPLLRRGMEIETRARAERRLRGTSRDCSARSSDDWGERQDRFGLVTFGAGADRGYDGHDVKFRVREVLEACKTVSFAGGVWARSLVVGDKSGSRELVCTVGRATGGLEDERRCNEMD